MKARLGKIVDALATSLWFVPSLLVLLTTVSALGLIELDRHVEPRALGVAGLIFHGGPEGGRAVLSAVASSMMTVTGVTFSVMVVALTLASQQYTPRVLRHFAADRGNQVVLGTFIGTFVYSLLVLRTIRADSAGRFVPHIAVTGGVLLAVLSLALLIYFIHHSAASIRPSSILSRVSAATFDLIDHLFPEPLGMEATEAEARAQQVPEGLGEGTRIPAAESGYVQAVDLEALMRLTGEEDLLLAMEQRVGEFVSRGAVIATVWPQDRVHPELARLVNGCFVFGPERTFQQDPEYGVIQIADIAVKALSPGINDPTTAITCLDYLGDLLRYFGQREVPAPWRKDSQGRLRVRAEGTNFGRMVDLAFSQIYHYGRQDPAVTFHLLKVLRQVAPVVREDRERREVLCCFLDEVVVGARNLVSAAKREQVERSLQHVRALLRGDERAVSGDEGEPVAA